MFSWLCSSFKFLLTLWRRYQIEFYKKNIKKKKQTNLFQLTKSGEI